LNSLASSSCSSSSSNSSNSHTVHSSQNGGSRYESLSQEHQEEQLQREHVENACSKESSEMKHGRQPSFSEDQKSLAAQPSTATSSQQQSNGPERKTRKQANQAQGGLARPNRAHEGVTSVSVPIDVDTSEGIASSRSNQKRGANNNFPSAWEGKEQYESGHSFHRQDASFNEGIGAQAETGSASDLDREDREAKSAEAAAVERENRLVKYSDLRGADGWVSVTAARQVTSTATSSSAAPAAPAKKTKKPKEKRGNDFGNDSSSGDSENEAGEEMKHAVTTVKLVARQVAGESRSGQHLQRKQTALDRQQDRGGSSETSPANFKRFRRNKIARKRNHQVAFDLSSVTNQAGFAVANEEFLAEEAEHQKREKELASLFASKQKAVKAAIPSPPAKKQKRVIRQPYQREYHNEWSEEEEEVIFASSSDDQQNVPPGGLYGDGFSDDSNEASTKKKAPAKKSKAAKAPAKTKQKAPPKAKAPRTKKEPKIKASPKAKAPRNAMSGLMSVIARRGTKKLGTLKFS